MLSCYARQFAVKLTHIPTGISAYCDSERGQHRNKAAALNLLRARLYAAGYVVKVEDIVREYETADGEWALSDDLLDEIGPT
jgi:protein subunit release factor A